MLNETEKAYESLEILDELMQVRALFGQKSKLKDTDSWQDVPEIVKFSLKAIEKVLYSHSSLFKHYENLISNMVNKQDMKSALSLKANVVDIHESMKNIGDALEQKVSIEELQKIMQDFRIDGGARQGMNESRRFGEDGSRGLDSREFDEMREKVRLLEMKLSEVSAQANLGAKFYASKDEVSRIDVRNTTFRTSLDSLDSKETTNLEL